MSKDKVKPYSAEPGTVLTGPRPGAKAPAGPQRLGDLLADRGVISAEQLREALLSQGAKGQRLGATLVQLGLLSERELAEALAEQSGLLLVDLAHETVDRDVAMLLSESDAKRLVAIPIGREGERVDVAVADPYADGIQAQLIEQLGAPVRLRVAAGIDILQAISDAHVRVGDMDDVVRVFEERAEQRKRQAAET